MKAITPETLLNEAVLAINKGHWDRAVAFATTGLLKAAIDAKQKPPPPSRVGPPKMQEHGND